MKGWKFLVCFILATATRRDAFMGVHGRSLSANFETENFSFGTPTTSCEECISRAREYYHRTVSDPEEFCISNHLCVPDPDFDTLPPSLQASDDYFVPAEVIESTPPEISKTNDSKKQNSIPVAAGVPYEAEGTSPPIIAASNSTSQLRTPGEPASETLDEKPLKSEDSLSANELDFDFDATDNNAWRTTVSSIFLKNLTTTMDQDVSEIFSIVALDFLRDYSKSGSHSDGVDFVMIEVMGQGQEYGNSTEFDMHIEGVHVFFETLVNLEENSQIDLPRLIESIFKNNKDDFFFRLAEENDYFIPLSGKVPPFEVETVPFEFLGNTWVVASLAAVASSVLVSAIILLSRRGRKTRRRKDYKDTTKQDTYPLCTLEQTYSEGSTPTNQSGGNHPSHQSAADILTNLEGAESLMGLKLLHSEAITPTNSPRHLEDYENKYVAKRSGIESKDSDEESILSKARMRKRQIEKDYGNRRSEAGTTMGAILIATESLKSEDEADQQKTSIEVVEREQSPPVECISTEPQQKRSFMDQVTTIFRPMSKQSQQVPRLEPVRMNHDDDSDLSFLSTPHGSKNNSFLSPFYRRGDTPEDGPRSVPRGILKMDKCESPFSPVVYSNYARNSTRNTNSPANFHVIKSPTSEGLKRFNTATPKGYYHR